MKNKIVSTLAGIALIVIMVGATYAYLTQYNAADDGFPVEITTNTVDSLVFSIDTDISFTATPANFDKNMGNRDGVAHAKAILKANNKTHNASGEYYLYLDITENGLTYTTGDETPELLLQVSGPDGDLGDGDIAGLDYKTVVKENGDRISGFDITTKQDLITIANKYTITTTSEKTDNWEIRVVFVNLDTDQKDNGGKKFNGELLIQKEPWQTIANVCNGKNLAQCIKENYELDSNIYYHKNLANSAEDESYRYAGSYESVENYVCFGDDIDGACPYDKLYRIIGVFGDKVKLIKADYAGESALGVAPTTLTDVEKGERYYKGNFNAIPRYYWTGSNNYGPNINVWANSTLNKSTLNGTYLNKLGTKWEGKIATTSWVVGGNIETAISLGASGIAKNAYQNEILNPLNTTKEVRKIGLMYVSDYMYAATPNYWLKPAKTHDSYPDAKGNHGEEYDYRSAINDNWMHIGGLHEWTITPLLSGNYSSVFIILSDGLIQTGTASTELVTRPVFYLNSDVTLIGGAGTQENPYLIN